MQRRPPRRTWKRLKARWKISPPKLKISTLRRKPRAPMPKSCAQPGRTPPRGPKRQKASAMKLETKLESAEEELEEAIDEAEEKEDELEDAIEEAELVANQLDTEDVRNDPTRYDELLEDLQQTANRIDKTAD